VAPTMSVLTINKKRLTMLIMGKNNPVKATAAVVALDGPPQNIVLIFSVCYAYASRPSLPLYMLSSSLSLVFAIIISSILLL